MIAVLFVVITVSIVVLDCAYQVAFGPTILVALLAAVRIATTFRVITTRIAAAWIAAAWVTATGIYRTVLRDTHGSDYGRKPNKKDEAKQQKCERKQTEELCRAFHRTTS